MPTVIFTHMSMEFTPQERTLEVLDMVTGTVTTLMGTLQRVIILMECMENPKSPQGGLVEMSTEEATRLETITEEATEGVI
jgi:hypothetical protein